MFGTDKRKLIAEQVSSSLQNPSDFSEAEVIEPSAELSANGSSTSPKEESPNDLYTKSDSQKRLEQWEPSLEECLYGTRRKKSPFIPNDDDEEDDNLDEESNCDGDDNGDEKPSELGISLDDNDGLNSRWSLNPDVSADYHDINMALLRKLCSQGSGIPDDEGPRGESGDSNNSNGPRTRGTCHRGIAWRILLEQLPTRDIYATWPTTLPPQRKLYRELVEKYLENAIDPGREIKGQSHWEQSLQSDNAGSNDKFDQQSEAGAGSDLNSSTHIRATEDIYEIFPPNSKYRELWQKSGITLNLGESAAAIGMNRLRVPKSLLEQTDNQKASDTVDEGNKNKEESSSEDLPGGSITEKQKDDIFEQFLKDAKLLSEIRKDVVRTSPHLRFYLEPQRKLGVRRHAALERILFVWAKLNSNLYVQGMNEIVGTLYYVLAMDPTVTSGKRIGSKRTTEYSWADHAEADTYYLFNSLLNTMEVRDVFIADLDHDSEMGLHARIKNIEMLLKEHDPEIYNHLKGTLGIDSGFYAIRWLTTLLSREFRLPDTIRLWDSMLASTHKENFLRYVCATMVMAIRDRLLCGDFGTSLKLLQNYPSGKIGMDELLESSRALWVYETQILTACQKGGIPLRRALNMIKPPDGVIMAFGRPGGKPLRLSIPDSAFGVKQSVSSATSAANNNRGNFLGRVFRRGTPANNSPTNNVPSSNNTEVKRRWGWGTPQNESENNTKNNLEKSTASEGKRRWGFGSPNIVVNSENTLEVDASGSGDANDSAEEWDLIDSIIDGKIDFVSSCRNSSNGTSSTADSTVLIPKLEEPTDSSSSTPAWNPSTHNRIINTTLYGDDDLEDFAN